jgi:hypothetical protein
MRRLSVLALMLVALPLAACGSTHRDTTVIAQPGSTVVAPGAHVQDPN